MAYPELVEVPISLARDGQIQDIQVFADIIYKRDPNKDTMVNLNTINRIAAVYNDALNRKSDKLLKSADSVHSTNNRHDKSDRRHLAERRREIIRVLPDRRKNHERRHNNLDGSKASSRHSIDLTA